MWQDSENAARICKTAPVFVHRIGLTASARCCACAASCGAISLSWRCSLIWPQASSTPSSVPSQRRDNHATHDLVHLVRHAPAALCDQANDELLRLQTDPGR